MAVRLGRGLKDFPPVQGYTDTVIVAWSPQSSYVRILEPEVQETPGGPGVPHLHLHREWDDWPRLRVVQLLMNDAPSQETTEDVRENRQVEPAPFVQDSPEWLSTNPDHSSEDSASAQSLATILRNDDPALQCCLQNTHAFLEDQIAGPLSSPPDLQATDERRPPLALWSINPDHLRHREAIHANPEDLPDEVELAVYPPMTVTIPDLPA